MQTGVWCTNMRETDNLEDLILDRRIILKLTFLFKRRHHEVL